MRHQTRFIGYGCLALCGLFSPTLGLAQDGTGAMGQGQANINVRSDVRLGIKGTRSTTLERLNQLTEVVTDAMPELRKCYRDLIAKHPTTVGALAIRIELDEGKGPALELKETGGTAPELRECVERVLKRAPFKKVGRPAAAVATLEFDNTRAKGQEAMAQRMEATDRIDVKTREDGSYEAKWASNDGRVAFAVAGKGSSAAVEATLRTLRDAFAVFADCRRRSEKDGKSPAGELQVQLRLQRGGESAAKIIGNTVAHERAPICIERAFKKLTFKDAPAGQRTDVTIRFAP